MAEHDESEHDESTRPEDLDGMPTQEGAGDKRGVGAGRPRRIQAVRQSKTRNRR